MIAYDAKTYNCAHHMAKTLNDRVGAEISFSDGDEWQVQFLRKLKRDFTKIRLPVDNCLVVMSDLSGGLHVGVYRNYLVEHNHKSSAAAGSVIMSDLGTIRSQYKRIRYYDYNKKILK